MRQAGLLSVVLLALVALTIGCSSNNRGQLEGTKWSSLATTIHQSKLAEGAFKLEFGANGSLAFQAGEKVHEGTYTLAGGDTVVFHFTEKVRGQSAHTETIKVSGDRLTTTDPDGTEITYAKIP